MSRSGVSIVVASRDRPDSLRETLEVLRRCVRPGDELIVVDSASRTPETRAVVEAAGARYVRAELPGLARARNHGWRAAGTDVIAFTDDDCVVAPDWIERIEDAFADPLIGFVTGRTLGDREASIGTATIIDEVPRRFEGSQDPARFGGGGNAAFRRVVLEQLGGFDEMLGAGTAFASAEDHDAFWRALRVGWAGAFVPGIVITHKLWRTRLEAVRREYDYGLGAGAFAMKLIRQREPDGWPIFRARLWGDGIAASARNLVRGYESGAVAAAFKAVGVAVGGARASRLRVEDGVFRRKKDGKVRRR